MPRRRDLVVVGDRLHQHILQAMEGRSQSDVARRAGLSRQYVHNVINRTETTRQRPQLRRLLEALDLDLEAYDTDPTEREQAWTLPSKFNRVSNEDRVEAERVLDWMLRLRERSGRQLDDPSQGQS